MRVEIDNVFDTVKGDPRSAVFQAYPSVFGDSRGFFAEVFKFDGIVEPPAGAEWFTGLSWVRQVNRSSSSAGVVRGCHAQSGRFCQGKLVQALTETVYDVITDARPDSSTFGVTNVYVLDPGTQNALWVPRGFLHGFVVPFSAKGPALFEYACDEVYDKASEIGVAPMSFLPAAVKSFKKAYDAAEAASSRYSGLFEVFADQDKINLSEKDSAAPDYMEWMVSAKGEFDRTGKAWYRS